MTARLDITRAQIKAIAEGAREAGCVVEIEINGKLFRIKPEQDLTSRTKSVDSNEDFDL